jgi:hypothetical protein
MNARALLFLLPLALWACQDTLYPVAPNPPERVTTGSADPGTDPVATTRGPYGGQLVTSGAHALEFVGFTPSNGSYTLYLFPWDATLNPVPRTAAQSEAKLKLSDGQEIAMTAATNPDDGSLFFYAFPGSAFETLSVTVQAEVSLAGTALSASFTHPDR